MTGQREIVVMTPRLPFLLEELRREFTVHAYWEAEEPDAFFQQARHARAVVTNGVVGCPREVVEALPQLGLICVGGVGLDAVDVSHAHKRGIRVTTTPGVLTADVADQAVALLLAASRQLRSSDHFIREGGWERGEDLPLTRRVSGKRAGIVGLGEIGKAIARRLSAFDMSVAYTGRREQPEQPYRFVAGVVELAREVDVLVVSSAGGEGTRHLINAQVLAALGPQGILINIARGSVVDEEALIASLQSGQLGAAGLDVFAAEPNVPAALKALNNVVLSPHAATRTVESRQDISRIVLENLEAFFAGRALVTALPLEPER